MEIIQKTNKQELFDAIALKIEQGFEVKGFSTNCINGNIVYFVFLLNPSLL